jgi:hypothetical protein
MDVCMYARVCICMWDDAFWNQLFMVLYGMYVLYLCVYACVCILYMCVYICMYDA